jgi:hypothetical protein
MANEHKIHTNENQVTTIYKQAERFAEITKSAIVSGNIVRAKKCLALPNDYLLLSYETKNAISNVYVFLGFYFHGIAPLQHFQSFSSIVNLNILNK